MPADLVNLIRRLEFLHPTRTADTAGTVEVAGLDETVRGLSAATGFSEIGRLAHYRVLRIVGAGGMGVVFQAEGTTLGRYVALMVMRPRKRRAESVRARFLREAKAMAALRHDNITVIHQVGEEPGRDARPVPFLAMELLTGEGLDTWMRHPPRTPAA